MDITHRQIVNSTLYRFLVFLTGFTLFSFVITGCNNLSPDFKTDKIQPESSKLITKAPSGNPTLRLANGEWIPFTGKDLPNFGCDSQVVTEAFSTIGYTVVFDFFPWARAYRLGETGERDGTIEWDDTPEHRKAFFISAEPLSDQDWVFFYRNDHPFKWKTLDDLEGMTVGITSGYVYSDVFREFVKKGNVNFEEASSDEANFQKLLAGRIDVFPMEKSVGNYLIRKTFSPDDQKRISYDPNPLHKFYPYLLLSRVNPLNAELMEQFNTSLRNLKNSEKYKEIMQNCMD
jgi:polar amino acid transport system substrate-binding protein